MAEDNHIEIGVGVTTGPAEKGVNRINASMESIDSKGRKVSSRLVGYFQNIRTSIQKVQAVMSTVSFFTLWINAVGDLIKKFQEWRGQAEKVRKEHEKLAREAADKKMTEAVREISDSYAEIREHIAGAIAEQQRMNGLISEETSLRRAAEDADLKNREVKELAAVDSSDPDAAEKKAQIRAKYEGIRSGNSASRAREDVVLRRQELQSEAAAARAGAQSIEDTLAGDDRQIIRARSRYTTSLQMSTELNEKDLDIFGRVKKTADGDAVRERYRQDAEKAKAEVEKLEGIRAKKDKEIAELRKKASDLEARRDLLGKYALPTASVNAESVSIEGGMSNQAAARTLANKQIAREDAEAARAAELAKARSNLFNAKSARAGAAAAAQSATEAYQNYRGSDQAQVQRLYNAMQTAQAALAQADKTVETLTKTLDGVTKKLKALEDASSRQSTTNSGA